MAADEGDYIELLVANQRIGDWVDRLRSRGNLTNVVVHRQKQAILHLQKAVESRSAYAEEARKAGVVPLLTRLLGLTGSVPTEPQLAEDEGILDAASAIIAACSGPMACAGKVSEYCYEGLVVRVKEGALGDGLGAKVWMLGHMLCRELACHPQLLAGRMVLELGSGCGIGGITAAKAGAGHVVMTDVEAAVLRNLRACVHLNMDAGQADPADGDDDMMVSERAQQGHMAMEIPTDAELFDDAEEMDADGDFDLGDMVLDDSAEKRPAWAGGGGGRPPQHQQRFETWDAANVSVRMMDWAESVAALDGAAAPLPSGAEDLPPRVPAGERFPLIIGSEVVYERPHAELVAAVVAHRLAPGGCALLYCAVRELRLFRHLAREAARRGLRYRTRALETPCVRVGGLSFEGLIGRLDEYEGGFVAVALDHEAAPCQWWYRGDFVEGVHA